MLWILFSCCFVFPLFSVWRFWSFELDLHKTHGLLFQLYSSACHCSSFSFVSLWYCDFCAMLCFAWFGSVILVSALTFCFTPFCLIWHLRFDRMYFGLYCFYAVFAILLCFAWFGSISWTGVRISFCHFYCDIGFSVCIVYPLFYLILPFAYCYYILFLVDVLQSGIWREANSLVDPSLRRLVPNLRSTDALSALLMIA